MSTLSVFEVIVWLFFVLAMGWVFGLWIYSHSYDNKCKAAGGIMIRTNTQWVCVSSLVVINP